LTDNHLFEKEVFLVPKYFGTSGGLPPANYILFGSQNLTNRCHGEKRTQRTPNYALRPLYFPFVPFAMPSSLGLQKGGPTQRRKGKRTQSSPSYTLSPLPFPFVPFAMTSSLDSQKGPQRPTA
jgi:hypothetical protein